MKVHAFRLHPGQELRQEIQKFAATNNIKAGFIVTAVGGLGQTILRMPDTKPEAEHVEDFEGPFEIVSLVGTLEADDLHLHIALSDSSGRVIGGHLRKGIVRITCELVIGESESHEFRRVLDTQTGYEELQIRQKQPTPHSYECANEKSYGEKNINAKMIRPDHF